MNALQIFLDVFSVGLACTAVAIIWFVLTYLTDWIKWYAEYKLALAQNATERGPYTKVELRRVPNERMLEVVLFNGDEIVYRKGVDKP